MKNNNGVSLLAKWLPSEGKSEHNMAVKIKNHLGTSWKDYRNILTSLRDEIEVVEQKMCANNWEDIDFNQVPSQAINIYRNAFRRHTPEKFKNWVDSLYDEDGDSEIKADAIYPHQIVDRFLSDRTWGGGLNNLNPDEKRMLEAQWCNLPDYMSDGRKIIPVCDTSGSMNGDHAINVSIALGLYISERNRGIFENQIVTFSGRPTFFEIESDELNDRVRELVNMDWGRNTDLEKTVRLLLKVANKNNLTQDEMPETVLILSDMQFDRAAREPSDSAMEMIEREYEEAGYGVPDIVFWNLRDSTGKPVKFTDRGTALVSGFSPSILERVMKGDRLSPLSVAMDTVNSDRYKEVVV